MKSPTITLIIRSSTNLGYINNKSLNQEEEEDDEEEEIIHNNNHGEANNRNKKNIKTVINSKFQHVNRRRNQNWTEIESKL